MNIKKIEKQLKKVNQLFDTIKEDGAASAIERDLMLSYIRGLYEKIVLPQTNSEDANPPTSVTKPKKIEEVPTVIEAVVPANNIADVVMQEVVEADQFVTNTSPDIQSEILTVPSVLNEVAVQEIIEPTKPQVPEELKELFKFESVNELSDKLSRAPISDLTKCMGINEKIFTVQELFGGDSALFSKAMEVMDNFSSIEQARDYLVENVAADQNWAAEGKFKKATNFIKLISRRY